VNVRTKEEEREMVAKGTKKSKEKGRTSQRVPRIATRRC
jgi:hypothetical protein